MLPLREWKSSLLWLAFLLSSALAQGGINGFINFAQNQVVVNEGTGSSSFTSVQIPLVREGGITGTVFAGITIQNDVDSDFFSTTYVASFSDGETSSSVTVIINNDNLPEGNETFTLVISDARNGAEVGLRSTMTLVILASDEPFGSIQFDSSSLSLTVEEPLSSPSDVQLTVTRGPGTFGRVTVDYQVSSDPSGMDDLASFMGQLVFEDRQSSQLLTLTILPDNTPEIDEVFTVQLSNPGGGATLASNGASSIVTIRENDSPLRWSVSLVEVEEDVGSVELIVTRGQLEDGSTIGDLSQTTTVTVTTVSGTASSGLDFTPVSTTVTFAPGSTAETVTIAITDDQDVEGDEMFSVTLSSPSSDSVLVPPSTVTVIIAVNDNAGGMVSFVSPGPVIIQEDTGEVGRFRVQRTIGTFGNLTIEWRIRENVNQLPAVNDFQPSSGTLFIPDGAGEATLEIVAFNDDLAEVAEGFNVELVGVVTGDGSISETGVRVASLIVTESDDVYGLVEWGDSLSVTDTIPRELRLVVARSRGDIGTISVDFTVTYLPAGASEGDPSTVAVEMGAVRLQGGQSSTDLSVTIPESMFLESGGMFRAILTNSSLVGGATLLIPSAVSPRIGPRATVSVLVPASAANGYIGFDPTSLQVSAVEPATAPSSVPLTVTRSGSYGQAEVTWSISTTSADFPDIGATTGVLTIPHGSDTAQLEVTVLPDNIPEVDESLLVTLVTVNQNNQRIHPNESVATVTILQNDAAEGVFSISSTTAGPFLVEESATGIISIAIIREGGALTEELLSYNIPGGNSEILGGQGFASFSVGQRESTVTLLINDDDIPENNETYTFEISSLSGNADILGMPSSVQITILANDDYAGLFLFDSGSLDQTAVEPRDGATSVVTFTVQRSRGMFTDVAVTWEVVEGASDIQPTGGVVSFTEGQSSGMFQVNILPDNLFEQDEVFTVRLTSVSGAGSLSMSSTQARLTIPQNDDPINFRQSFLSALEGETAVFMIDRGGQRSDTSDVAFTVSYSSAGEEDVVISPVGGLVTFVPGQAVASISVTVIDDDTPEEEEVLTVSLVSATGDAVIVTTSSESTLLIAPSDDPNGVFQFEMATEEAEEGESVVLSVERLGGDFGTVTLSWTVYQLNSTMRIPAEASDIFPTTNLLTFEPGNTTASFTLNILDDILPELAERFEVELLIINIDGDSEDGARIGDIPIATLTIGPSDDPYGLFSFSRDYVEVAEDVPTDNPSLGSLSLAVLRESGNIGEVRVMWEILPEALPSFTDLLLVGEAVSGVTGVTPRPHTGTQALNFEGNVGNLVSVPLEEQPDLTDQLSISLWLKPTSGTSGILVAQATSSTPLYRLSLVADSVNFIIRFSYRSGVSLLSGETSIAQSSLTDGAWHSLVLSATNQMASFYMDGIFLTSRILTSPIFGGRGQLTVGGVLDSISSSDFYSGDLQDVRIFSTALTQRQVSSLTSDTPSLSITPTSGYLTYAARITTATIEATTIDDDVPEPSQLFVVQLTNAVGGARINPSGSTASLNVLKSDSGNGVFGFNSSSVAVTTSEGTRLSLLITRSGGLFGGVSVYWEIRREGEVASLDFEPSSGRVDFSEGQLSGALELTVIDELVPELQEEFVITLTSAVADDNQTSSTPLSGASIDPASSQATVSVIENDSPYGLLQFVTSPPLPGATISPATVPPELFVEESVGTVMVYVVRAQGRLGDASVEYLTSEGSAESESGSPDFTSTAGSLDFSGDAVTRVISVTVLDNQVPELQKTFYVNLTNPSGSSGTPDLGLGSSLAVHILPSDDAFGRFNFNSDSRARVVAEEQGGTPVTLTVVREGGVFGDVTLFWRVTQSLGSEVNDITPNEGTLVFSEGSSEENIELTIRDDLSAELSEVFSVILVNVSVGASLGPASTAVITVAASDHPYGLFTFAPPPTGVSEGQEVVVTVIREFGTVGQVVVGVISIESSDQRLSSLSLDLDALREAGQLATPGLDYSVIDTTVTFEPGQTAATLSLTLLPDALPELRELVFLTLTQATLNVSSVDAVDTSVLPQVAPGNESIAVVQIEENDNARGVFELSQVAVTTTEPSGPILSIVRGEGTFGEIFVQWEAVPVTASEADYTQVGGTVTFAPGESEMSLPLAIVDDNIPEFPEEFLVRLVGVAGSAILGNVTVATVTIQANDDPNGALEFATTALEVAEPDSAPATAAFTVQRVGGAVGVVVVSWNVTSVDGSPVSDDVLPVSGTLEFVSNSRERTIRLSVLPDQIPELEEVFVVRLGSVTGGARVEETLSTATLTIPGNDNAHGIVSFASPTSVAIEMGENGTSVTMVPLIRSLGTFGDLLVTYSVQSTDAATLALASGRSLLDFYTAPTPDTALPPQFQLQSFQGSLDDCATGCLGNQGCRSFSLAGADCTLYFTSISQGAGTVVSMGTDYYERIEELVSPFYQAVASEGNDFTSVVGRTLTIPDGVAMTSIPVTIVGDALPELNESLVIRLGNVELVSGDTSSGAPALGSITETSLVILENDDPRGRFAIYGSNGAAVTRVGESEMFDFGVSLTVERQGGTLGAVSVQWGVANSTAVEGEDYTGTGAVLTFPDGVSRATVALTILADDVPEEDETIRVTLSNPMGGALVGEMGTTLVIIEANDNAGGVVGFAPFSRSAVIGEGESGGVELVRSVSAFGVVRVSWRLTSENGQDPTSEFVSTSGTATFQEGETTTQVVISVQADSRPEVEERYTLTLTAVETLSNNVSPSGHAIFDPLATMATVTIQASNNPHGVVEFQSSTVRLEEGGAEGVAIVRQFGSFGMIDVVYSVEEGSRGPLAPGQSLATPAVDFVEVVGTVRMVDGQQSAVIAVNIVDDSIPELDEVFIVRLTSVTLVGGANNTLPPSLGASNVSDVIITPNDSPQGEMTFVQAEYVLAEDVGVFELPILRVQGVVGEVSVVYFVTNELAVNGEDFSVEQLMELTFAPGQSQRTVSIAIINDTVPEIPERFCVQLQLPRFGAVLGNITTTCVTISASDDAYGVFSFEASSLVTFIQETSGVATDSNVAELRVTREGGLFGTVTVPFEVRSADNELTTSDLSPLMGSALVFNPDTSFRIIQLEAVQDAIPELNETFSVTLLSPIEFGRLASTNTMATVTIESNQDPYGLFELSVVGGATSVEEDSVLVDFVLSRTFGTFGDVAVTMETVDETATFSPGSTPAFSAFQSLSGGEVWHSVSVGGGGQTLLVFGGETETQLLAWRGVFTPVQTLPSTQVSAIISFSPQSGVDLLLVGNGGVPGNRQLTVDVYQFSGPESVTLLQSLPSQGVTDLAAFSAGGQWYVLATNGEDNTGNTIVDSTVWRWNGTGLERFQSLETQGASSVDVFTLSGSLYAVVGSLTDTRSPVYVWRDGQLRLHHNFDSNSVEDVLFVPPASLAVASLTLSLLVWSPTSQNFVPNATLSTEQPIRSELFNEQLFVTNANSPGQIFALNEGIWVEAGPSVPTSIHLYPFTLDSTSYLASAGTSRSVVMETLLINMTVTDYFSRRVSLRFAPGESALSFSVRIVNDGIPEIGESFRVQLTNPVGGARIGASSSIAMEILTNDDAHGLVQFAESSLSVIAEEGDMDSVVVLDVVRMGGAFGRVSVAWEISGSHGIGEITPTQGEVVFAEGQSQSAISLLLTGDATPELSEMTFVTLTRVVENGVPEGGDSSRGASIVSERAQAVITVQASDAPHGVVSWSPAVVMTTEVDGVDNVVSLTLVREFGSIGAIVISYSTVVASLLPAERQASALTDFVPSSGDVVMGNGVSTASVTVTILHDNQAEVTESFLVNITNVRLLNEADRQGSVSNSPRVGLETVEVKIIENDDSRGLLSFAVANVSVEEVVGGRAVLEVRREAGTFGEVGVTFTAVGVSASSLDFEPASGSVTIASGEAVGFIEISIVNDPAPELDETFEVTLVNGVGGARIGEPSSVLVTILSNDDINGVFSFTDNSLLLLIPESSSPTDPMGVVTLTVQRMANFVGVVTVYWEVEEDGLMDLEPTSGSLTFEPPTSMQSFQVRAVSDGLPEQFEAFSVRLVRTEGGGRIIDPREARIAIQSNNDPSGVVGFVEYPQGIVANEGAEIQLGVVRNFGTQGTVTLTWAISPPDATVFLTTTDTVVLTDAQAETTFAVQTLSDAIPEVARLFSLDIVSASLAGIDVNSSHVDLIIAASDNPHGTVEFASGELSVEEGETGVSVTILRGTGLVGDLGVNFDLQLGTADESDFTISSQYLLFPSGMSAASLSLDVLDDVVPEIAETFTLTITSVELLGNEGRDFEFAGDNALIDQPPVIGPGNQITVTIQPSDDPFGSVSLTRDTFTAQEGSFANITLSRSGGALGVATVTFTTTDGLARSPADYSTTSSSVQFLSGETSAYVLVSIADDTTPELEEDFVFTLTGSTLVALGPITTATVIIETSDSPFGVVGFDETVVSSGIVTPNPTSEQTVTLDVTRSGGAVRSTEITWEVRRSTGGEFPRDDITPVSGVLVLADGQFSGQIMIVVLPSNTDEGEESYVVTLVLASNDVGIDSDFSSVEITVQQIGNPQGSVSFIGDVLSDQRVNEGTVLSLPVIRTGAADFEMIVTYRVTRGDGSDNVSEDVAPPTGSVVMPQGISQVNLELSLLRDGVPELDESFQVVLTGTNVNGVSVDPLANTAPFTIGLNESPFGSFSLSTGAVTVDSTQPLVSRSLRYTIERSLGLIGDVTVTISNSYTDSSANYVPATVTRVLSAGSSSLPVSLNIAEGAFLSPGSEFTAVITSAVVAAPSEQAGQSADIVSEAVVGVVNEENSNTLVSLDSSSLSVSLNDMDGSVQLTVIRVGVLDTVDVQWSVGALVGGELTPAVGSVSMTPNQASAIISLTATPTEPHGLAEVFSVSLTVQSQTANFPARVDQNADTALIEPRGVIELGGTEFSGVEGQLVSVPVWRRYGSMGDITVTGVASMSSDIPANHIAATGGVDYPVIPQSVAMGDGQTVGYINISLPDNTITSSLKVFTFTLTGASRTTPTGTFSSPRLSSSNLIGRVIIVDDEGGAGVFRVSPNVARVEEGGVLSFTVSREGGTSGEVGVLVRSVDGEASGGVDYASLSQQLVFGDGESVRLLTVPVLDDSLPEADEGFRVELVGGIGALIDPVNGILDVTIPASDNPGGIFTISTPSNLTLVDGTTPTATITVERSGGLIGVVTISWEAVYADSAQMPPIASFLSVTGGRISFLSGQTVPDNVIQLSLISNAVPAEGATFVLRISSTTPGIVFETTEIQINARPRAVSVFQIPDRMRVVTALGPFTMTIDRTDGLQLTSTLIYETSSVNRPDNPVPSVGELNFELAQPGIHFARIENAPVTFEPGESTDTITLSVISLPSSPVAFYLDISIQGTSTVSDTAVIVVMPPSPLSELYSLYFQSLTITTPPELEMVSSSLATVVMGVSGSDNEQSTTLRLIIDQLISTTLTSGANVDPSTNNYIINMLDVFNYILTDDSFTGQSLFVQSMKSFAYSLVEDSACPITNTEVLKSYSQPAFFLEGLKIRPELLANRQFAASGSNDYVQFPAQSLSTSQTCVTVHFIVFLSNQIFGQPTFGSRVMSVGVANRDIQPVPADPILLRVHTAQAVGAIPDSNDCIQWTYPSLANPAGQWSSEFCSPVTEYGNVLLEDSVLCTCRQFGDLAVSSNITLGYSWTWPAGVSAGFVAIVMVLVILLHLCYLSRTQLATRLLLCLCLAIFLFQLILFIDVFASRSPSLSADGCVTLGALLHFTIVLQFVFIMALGVALWVNFMGFTDGREPLVAYVIVGWGVAIIVIVATILIGRFAVPLSNTQLYFHTNGELCFIPSLPVSLLSVVLPVIVCILIVAAFLSHSCVYWSRWEDYHNMYHDSFNRTEIPLLLVFFALVFFTGLAGYLHVYVTVVYTFAAFVALNIIQGLYALIVYFFVSWHTLTSKHKKFVLGDEVEPLPLPEEPDYLASMDNLSTSRHKLDPQEEWDRDSDMTPVYGVGITRYDDDENDGNDDDKDSREGNQEDDSHLDDLMFMLRTQTYQSDEEGLKGTPTRPKGTERLELRPISIADTHL